MSKRFNYYEATIEEIVEHFSNSTRQNVHNICSKHGIDTLIGVKVNIAAKLLVRNKIDKEIDLLKNKLIEVQLSDLSAIQ